MFGGLDEGWLVCWFSRWLVIMVNWLLVLLDGCMVCLVGWYSV